MDFEVERRSGRPRMVPSAPGGRQGHFSATQIDWRVAPRRVPSENMIFSAGVVLFCTDPHTALSNACNTQTIDFTRKSWMSKLSGALAALRWFRRIQVADRGICEPHKSIGVSFRAACRPKT